MRADPPPSPVVRRLETIRTTTELVATVLGATLQLVGAVAVVRRSLRRTRGR